MLINEMTRFVRLLKNDILLDFLQLVQDFYDSAFWSLMKIIVAVIRQFFVLRIALGKSVEPFSESFSFEERAFQFISGLPSAIMYDDRMLSMRFPQKLWKIVNACKSGAIRWNVDGSSILLDYKKFQEEYLDGETSIFKTRNITSFIRQLNLYGFRKVTSHNRDPLCSCYNPYVHEFMHEHFHAGRVELLSRVCRKTIGKNKYFQNLGPLRCKDATPVSHLRMCQLALTETLEQISREYRQQFLNASIRSEPFSSVSSKQGLPEFKIISIPQIDRSQEYLIKNGMHFYSKRNCSSINNVPQPWFIPSTHNFAFYMPLNNTK